MIIKSVGGSCGLKTCHPGRLGGFPTTFKVCLASILGDTWKILAELAKHHRAIHKREKHKCKDCGSQFTDKSSQNKHYKSVHLGIKYPCNMCSYKATLKQSLKTHQDKIHKARV